MKFTKQNLDEAIRTFLPGCENWKVDHITLAKMVAVDVFCFPEKVTSENEEHAQLIRTALTQLKIDGQFSYEN